MRLLKKKGTNGPAFPWTQLLADRGDMEEFDADPQDADAADPTAITDKAALKQKLADLGVTVSGNPSLKTLQDKLAEAQASAGQ